ncbi:MAG: hypothetical protein LBQ06_06185 [Frankiaceae bacterium]|jgi:hypothetical protein|nr:hypothetical protein [Frankiaceae bacterium]
MVEPPSPETPLDFPREWVEFADPANPDHLIRADLTWLCSRWTCIFGSGCPGVVEARPADGCCSHGAFFSDEQDEARIERAAQSLTAEHWQHRDVGRARGIAVRDSIGEDTDRRRTRRVGGACVFLNRPGFAGGPGCALHLLALRTGAPLHQTKPEVCWQLPQRRVQEWRVRPDGTALLVSSLSEVDGGGWGEGGHDLRWWCTSSPRAHIGAKPVYLSCRQELTELIGRPGYRVLARFAAARLAAGLIAVHPASAEAERRPAG